MLSISILLELTKEKSFEIKVRPLILSLVCTAFFAPSLLFSGCSLLQECLATVGGLGKFDNRVQAKLKGKKILPRESTLPRSMADGAL